MGGDSAITAGAIFTAMASAIGFLFRELLKAKDRAISDRDAQIVKQDAAIAALTANVAENTKTMNGTTETIKKAVDAIAKRDSERPRTTRSDGRS